MHWSPFYYANSISGSCIGLSKSSSLSVHFSTKQDNWWYMVAKPPYSWHFDVALLYCIDELEVILNNMLTTNYIKFEKTLHVKDTANKPNPCHVELFPVNAWWYFIYLSFSDVSLKNHSKLWIDIGECLVKKTTFHAKAYLIPKSQNITTLLCVWSQQAAVFTDISKFLLNNLWFWHHISVFWCQFWLTLMSECLKEGLTASS